MPRTVLPLALDACLEAFVWTLLASVPSARAVVASEVASEAAVAAVVAAEVVVEDEVVTVAGVVAVVGVALEAVVASALVPTEPASLAPR